MGVFFMLKKILCLMLAFLTLYSLKVVSAKPIFSAFSSPNVKYETYFNFSATYIIIFIHPCQIKCETFFNF